MVANTHDRRQEGQQDGSMVDIGQPRRVAITVNPSMSSRRSVELSLEDSKLVRHASMLLTSPAGPEAVLTQAEIERRERLRNFGEKYFSSSKMKDVRRRRDGRSLSSKKFRASLSSFEDCDQHIDGIDDENAANVVVKQPRHPSPQWLINLRFKLRHAVKAKWFRAFLYLVVLADILVLALDNEYVTGSALARLDITFTVLLLMEVVLKVIAFGF